jgi:hypothetical protein
MMFLKTTMLTISKGIEESFGSEKVFQMGKEVAMD